MTVYVHAAVETKSPMPPVDTTIPILLIALAVAIALLAISFVSDIVKLNLR